MDEMCELCGIEEATLIKTEADTSWDDEAGREVITKVGIKICGGCAEAYYDGTEEFPGTRPIG
jgi:hypothetical protein